MTGGLNNTGSGNDKGKPPLPLPYPAAWRGILYKIGAKAKEEYISTSPLPCPVALRGVSVREYRGSARRARGLKQKQ